MRQLYFEQFTNHTASEWLIPKFEAAQFEWNFVGMGKLYTVIAHPKQLCFKAVHSY